MTRTVTSRILLVLIIMILPLNILFINSSLHSKNALIQQAESNITSIEQIYINNIDRRISATNSIMQNIVANNTYCQTVFNQRNDDNYKLCKFLLAQDLLISSARQTEGDIYFIYSPKLNDILLAKRPGITISTEPIKEFIINNEQILTSFNWNYIQLDGKPYIILTYSVRQMYLGTLIELNDFKKQLYNSIPYKTADIEFSDTTRSTNNGSSTISFVQSSLISNLHINCTVKMNELLKELSFFQKYSYLISILYLCLIPFIFIAFRFILLKPLLTLRYAIMQLKDGKQDYRINVFHSASEFLELNDSFNQMADNINQLTIKNYEQQIARQQIELDNLQLTIRPHFLQNTFALLFTLCQMGENEKLSSFILYLSQYFRYIYQGVHQLAPFDSELSIIKGYIDLAKTQHPDNFEIAYEITPDTQDVLVPPLLIHNFIENIISHALVRGKLLHILLCVETDTTNAYITIKDDGIGITRENVEIINQGKLIQDTARIHVGLHNSWQRIDKIYHGAASIKLSSAPHVGTTIKLIIPLNKSR